VRDQRHAPAAPYPRERPGTNCTGGWVGLRAGLDWCGKPLPTGIRSPDRPARRQSLYRLRYPAHDILQVMYIKDKQTLVFNFTFDLLWTCRGSWLSSATFVGFLKLKWIEKHVSRPTSHIANNFMVQVTVVVLLWSLQSRWRPSEVAAKATPSTNIFQSLNLLLRSQRILSPVNLSTLGRRERRDQLVQIDANCYSWYASHCLCFHQGFFSGNNLQVQVPPFFWSSHLPV